MRKWKRLDTPAGARFRGALDARECDLLASLVRSLQQLLDDRADSAPTDELEELTGLRTGHSTAPSDGTMRRLLPDFFRVQTEHPAGSATAESLNSALRSLHEPAIIAAKREVGQRVLDTLPAGGGRFELSEDDAHAWAAAVNDLRLALGSMLDIGADGPDRLSPEHPMAGHLEVYQWLTVLQEYLVLALLGKRG